MVLGSTHVQRDSSRELRQEKQSSLRRRLFQNSRGDLLPLGSWLLSEGEDIPARMVRSLDEECSRNARREAREESPAKMVFPAEEQLAAVE